MFLSEPGIFYTSKLYNPGREWCGENVIRTGTSSMRSPDCRRPSLTAAPRVRMFFTRMGPGPWTEESLVTTVKPRPSEPRHTQTHTDTHRHTQTNTHIRGKVNWEMMNNVHNTPRSISKHKILYVCSCSLPAAIFIFQLLWEQKSIHPLSLSLSHTHTRTHTHTHIHTHTHTQTHTHTLNYVWKLKLCCRLYFFKCDHLKPEEICVCLCVCVCVCVHACMCVVFKPFSYSCCYTICRCEGF